MMIAARWAFVSWRKRIKLAERLMLKSMRIRYGRAL
jgi:hypothetical protein